MYPNLLACFVTADLYDRTMVDTEPGLGEIFDMVSFSGGVVLFRDVALFRRDVACKVSTE